MTPMGPADREKFLSELDDLREQYRNKHDEYVGMLRAMSGVSTTKNLEGYESAQVSALRDLFTGASTEEQFIATIRNLISLMDGKVRSMRKAFHDRVSTGGLPELYVRGPQEKQ